jgi:hypothetical protein
MTRLAKFIQWGLLVLVALMPLHAFMSVSLGHVFGHQALVQSWKEVLLVILAAAALVLVIGRPEHRRRLRQPWILAGAILIVLGLVITALSHPQPQAAAFGLKTDFEFILAGFIAAVCGTKDLLAKLVWAVIIGAALVAGFDLLQIFLLPPDFLTAFGYGPETILPYQHISSESPLLRFPSTLGGPNQLGTYLILPLCLSLALFIKRRNWWYGALFAACLISLTYTFSRSAWIGAAAALVLTMAAVIPAAARRPAAIAAAAILAVLLAAVPFALRTGGPVQYLLLHSSVSAHDQSGQSDSQHVLSLHNGVQSLIANPLGHGLGTAGPSTFHTGSVNIIENFYLQLGYEIGLLALLLFLFCVGALVWALLKVRAAAPLAVSTAAALIGISVVAIVLPAWADSSTALIAWICAGAAAGSRYV